MARTIERGPIYDEARAANHAVVLVPEFVSADSAEELAEKIAVRRIKNDQQSAYVQFLSPTSAFIEFYYNISQE